MWSNQIISLPAYYFRVRIAQIVIAILILILDIVSTALFGGYGAFSYGIFTPIATCIIVVYWYLATYTRQRSYNRWAILILDCFAVVWWLSLWSVLASWAAVLGYLDALDNDLYGVSYGTIRIVHGITAVTAVLGAAEFILFIVSLVSFSTNLHRARKSEHQGGQQIPFTNTQQTQFPNHNQQMNDESITKPQAFHHTREVV